MNPHVGLGSTGLLSVSPGKVASGDSRIAIAGAGAFPRGRGWEPLPPPPPRRLLHLLQNVVVAILVLLLMLEQSSLGWDCKLLIVTPLSSVDLTVM